MFQRSTRLRKEHHENPEKESKAKVRDSSVAVGHDLTVGMGFVHKKLECCILAVSLFIFQVSSFQF